jgi:hypothetical protein
MANPEMGDENLTVRAYAATDTGIADRRPLARHA